MNDSNFTTEENIQDMIAAWSSEQVEKGFLTVHYLATNDLCELVAELVENERRAMRELFYKRMRGVADYFDSALDDLAVMDITVE